MDSERQPTQFTIFKFDKNSEDWCIYGPLEKVDVAGKVNKALSLTGYRISVNGRKVKFYFREPSFMEKWSVTTVMDKDGLIGAPLLLAFLGIILTLLILALI